MTRPDLRHGLLRATAVAMACGLALLLGAAPAFAHTRLEGSDPPDGASLATGPPHVSLTFDEAVQQGFTTLTVVGPDGGMWQTGDVTAEGSTVSIAVRPLGPAGRYQVGYRIVSDDGHPVTGSVAFTLTTAGSGVPTPLPGTAGSGVPTPPAAAASQAPPAAATGDSTSIPAWLWVVGAVLLVGGGIAVALRLGRG